MRGFVLGIALAVGSLHPAFADEPASESKEPDGESVFRELSSALPKDDKRENSAHLDLEYWVNAHLRRTVRRSVKTTDGKEAEIVLLTAPSFSLPGTDFSMAFMLVDKRVVDWASCWTYNRQAYQELLLEDVDGDGRLDVAFRGKEGFWGKDKRLQSIPGDTRKWLYAYAITAKGFRSLFPDTTRSYRLKVAYDEPNQPVTLNIQGLPPSLRAYEMCEITLVVKNTSEKELAIDSQDWLSAFKFDKIGSFRMLGAGKKRTVVKPGKTNSRTVRFYLDGDADEVTLQVKAAWRVFTTMKAPASCHDGKPQ